MGDVYVPSVSELLSPELLPVLIIELFLFLLMALFGFKMFKVTVVISGALVGYSLGAVDLAALIGDRIEGVQIGLILGVLCAVICALIATNYKLCVFLSSTATIFAVSLIFGALLLADESANTGDALVLFAISAVLALIGGFITYKFFKPIYIVFSSLGGMMMVFGIIAMLIFGENEIMIGLFGMAGMLVGIIPMIKQFKDNSNAK